MQISADAEIPDAKLTGYLLIYKPRNDKSKFLAQAGFTKDNPEVLRNAIQTLIDSTDAVEDGDNEFGTFYRVDGVLMGANGKSLSVSTIWIQRQIDNIFQFVTLKPLEEPRKNA